MKIKTRALRRRVWFRALSMVERGIVDLTIRCVEKIRSSVLNRILSEIVGKVMRTLENSFVKMAEKIGAEIANRVCGIALAWGNRTASRWKHDLEFIRFLGVNAVNNQVASI